MIEIILLLLFVYLYFKFKDQSPKYSSKQDPPAVRGSLPILGNLLSLGDKPHVKLMELAKEYGSIFTVKLGTQKTLVIDDPKLMRELFNEPAFSGRMENEALEYFSEGRNGIIMSEGKHWELTRRFTLKHLRDFGFGKNYMENLIIGEVNIVLDTLKEQAGKPFVVNGTFNLAVVNALWTVASGAPLSQDDGILMKLLHDSIENFNKLLTTGAMFSSFVRRLAPGLSGWNDFKSASDKLINFYKQTVEDHRKTHDHHNPRDLIDAYISKIKDCEDEDSPFFGETGYKDLRAVVGDLFQAGSETTATTLTWTILYLTVHKEVQDKLQKEIDLVVGQSRKTSLSDRIKMPYAEAVILEVLRKSSLVPLGVMHRAIFDKEFHGYIIRKGTVILGNLYSSHHNPEYWVKPETFMPERFLSPDGLELLKKPEALVPFQVGRRQCLGEQFAKDTLFLFITSIFQKFRTLPSKCNQELDLEPNPGFIHSPKPFSVTLHERILNVC